VTAHNKVLTLTKGVLLLFVAWGQFPEVVYSQNNPSPKIACVDIQRAINECNGGKEAKKALIRETEKVQNLVFEKQKQLQGMKESLDKQGSVLNPETRAAKEKELQAALRDYQRWGEDVQNEMNQKRMEMEKTIFIDLQKVIQKFGTDGGYTFILEKNENIVLFASKPTDVTDLVIKAYDAQKR